MLTQRVSRWIRLTAVYLVIAGAVMMPGSSRAVEVPPAGNVFALQTNGPNGLVTLGDWYSSSVAGAGGGYHYVRFIVPCGWPAGLPVYVDLFSPEMNRVSGALAQSEEPNGAYDSTQFELYGPGASIGPGYASPGPGAGIPGTRTTFQPGAVGVAEAWVRYATLAAPVACGSYVVRSQVLTVDPLNPAGTGNDQNGWRVRVGTDSDAIPTNPPPANYDNPDGLVGTNDELTLGVDQATFQQDSGALACQTFFEYVSPNQASIVFHNFDMDGNTRVRYYAPSDATYDPTAISGGVLGTLSINGQWNGGTLATRVGDTILTPESGWWRFVTCISTQNQFIQEGEAGRAAYYTQPPTPILTIAKSDGLAAVAPGQLITYTIDVDNIAAGATAGAANNVVVHDLLPAGVTYQSCGSPDPAQGTWSCSESGGNVTFTQTGWIDAGDAAQLTVTARVNQGVSGSIVNNVTADYEDQIGNPYLQVVASDTDTIVPSADLSITKTDGVASVIAGISTTYTITLTNNGPSDVPAGVVISDAIPANTTGSESEANCSIAAGVFTCTTAAALLSGGSVSFQLTLTLTASYAPPTLANTASITSSPTTDPVPGNNSATDIDTVATSADLSIIKTDSADPVDPGDSFFYTLTVVNNGPSDASGLTVTDTVPAGFTITSVTSALGTCGNIGNLAACTLGSLPLSSTWTITINVVVSVTPGGLYTDTATVTTTSSDPVPGNDTDTEGTVVTPAGDLSLTKTDGVASVIVGTSTTYTITVTNLGPSTVPAGVVISDAIPANTTGSESEANCAISLGVFTCTTTADLAPSASVSYLLTLTVDPDYPAATLVNTVTEASSPIPDPFGANNSATDTDTVTGSADLSITKVDSIDPVDAGDPVTYTLTVTNNGPSDAAAVVVTDTLPGSVVYLSATPSQGSCSQAAGVVTCPLGSFVLGATATVTIVVTTTIDGVITDTASVTSGTLDPVPGNNTDSEDTTIAPSADLAITKTDGVATVAPGTSTTYTITLTNLGPSTVPAGVIISDPVPAGTTPSSPPAGCVIALGMFTCTTTSPLAPSASVSYQLTLAVPTSYAPPTLANTASITSSPTTDPVPGNDSATDTDTVTSAADLSIVKGDSPDPVAVGAALTYTLSITNNGPSDATGATVTDTLPGTVTFGTATPSQGSCTQAAGVVTCPIGTILTSATATITITVTPTAPGTISNVATVSATSLDPVPGNNSDTEDTLVGASADLSITKNDGVTTVQAGAATTYTITITNNGPSDVPAGVVVTDQIPADTTPTENEANCAIAGTTLTCTTTALLPAGASVSYQLTLTLDPDYLSATLVNTATITTSPIGDTNATNNTATDTDAVTPIVAELSITKTDSADPVLPGDAFTYTITVSNSGPDAARSVVVTDTVPAPFVVTGVSTGSGICIAAGNLVTCSLDPLPAGATWEITVQVAVPADAPAGTFTNTATVAGIGDVDPSNNVANQPTTIGELSGSDLSVAKTVDDPSPQEGQIVTYAITVTNAGPDDATGLRVADVLPGGLTFVFASVGSGSYDQATGVWDVGALAVGDIATLVIQAQIDAGTAGTTITNVASVSSADQADPTPGDESDTAPIDVQSSGGSNGGGVGGTGGDTAFTGLPGGPAPIAWLAVLAVLGLVALATSRRGSYRRAQASTVSPSDHASTGSRPPARFLAMPFFFER